MANTHTYKLQIIQNTALRIATGCTRSTPTIHLQAEVKILSLKDHLELRKTQFYSSSRDTSYSLHYIRVSHKENFDLRDPLGGSSKSP